MIASLVAVRRTERAVCSCCRLWLSGKGVTSGLYNNVGMPQNFIGVTVGRRLGRCMD
jgi:hypothetical protein